MIDLASAKVFAIETIKIIFDQWILDLELTVIDALVWWVIHTINKLKKQNKKHSHSTKFTMILLVVPLGFSTGTELLKTRAQSSQTDFPMVNLDPPDSEKQTDRQCVYEGK